MDAAIDLFKGRPTSRQRYIFLITDGVPCNSQYNSISKTTGTYCEVAVPICGCITNNCFNSRQYNYVDKRCHCNDPRCMDTSNTHYRCNYGGSTGSLAQSRMISLI